MPPVDPKHVALEGIDGDPLAVATVGFVSNEALGAVGSIGTLSITPPQAAASGAVSIAGALPTLTLAAPSGSAVVGSVVNGGTGGRVLRRVAVRVQGVALGDLPSVTMSPPEASAIGRGSVVVAARFDVIDLSPPRDRARVARIERARDDRAARRGAEREAFLARRGMRRAG